MNSTQLSILVTLGAIIVLGLALSFVGVLSTGLFVIGSAICGAAFGFGYYLAKARR